jgi:hypothetical protein
MPEVPLQKRLPPSRSNLRAAVRTHLGEVGNGVKLGNLTVQVPCPACSTALEVSVVMNPVGFNPLGFTLTWNEVACPSCGWVFVAYPVEVVDEAPGITLQELLGEIDEVLGE